MQKLSSWQQAYSHLNMIVCHYEYTLDEWCQNIKDDYYATWSHRKVAAMTLMQTSLIKQCIVVHFKLITLTTHAT